MATKNIVPRANGEGGIGTSLKRWLKGFFTEIDVSGGVFIGGSSSSNKIDDYEEGTFTPTLTTDGVDFDSVTYDPLVFGKYQKIGSVVHIQIYMRTDAVTIGSASGSVLIGGLPFAGTNTYQGGAAAALARTWAVSTVNPSGGFILGSTLVLTNGDDGGLTSVSDVSTGVNGNQLVLVGSYTTSA